MTVIEEERPRALPIFGEITFADMSRNPLLAKTVMKLVKEVCQHSRGRYTAANITDGVIAGVCTIWGVMSTSKELVAIMVTAPNEGTLDVLLAGPELNDLSPFLPRLDGVARGARCTRLRMVGPGFWRKQLPEGWRPTVTVYERDLAVSG